MSGSIYGVVQSWKCQLSARLQSPAGTNNYLALSCSWFKRFSVCLKQIRTEKIIFKHFLKSFTLRLFVWIRNLFLCIDKKRNYELLFTLSGEKKKSSAPSRVMTDSCGWSGEPWAKSHTRHVNVHLGSHSSNHCPPYSPVSPSIFCPHKDRGIRAGQGEKTGLLRLEGSKASWSGFEVTQWAKWWEQKKKQKESLKELQGVLRKVNIIEGFPTGGKG